MKIHVRYLIQHAPLNCKKHVMMLLVGELSCSALPPVGSFVFLSYDGVENPWESNFAVPVTDSDVVLEDGVLKPEIKIEETFVCDYFETSGDKGLESVLNELNEITIPAMIKHGFKVVDRPQIVDKILPPETMPRVSPKDNDWTMMDTGKMKMLARQHNCSFNDVQYLWLQTCLIRKEVDRHDWFGLSQEISDRYQGVDGQSATLMWFIKQALVDDLTQFETVSRLLFLKK